jgi:nucleotide-binding universal stress UspA family protein
MALTNLTVVVPVDLSHDSDFAVKSGYSVAGDPARLHIIHVMSPLDSISAAMLHTESPGPAGQKSAAEHLHELAQKHDASEAHCVVLAGDCGTAIAEYAKKCGADLIVIPSHGYHGLKRLVLGSVTEKVIRHAECSVLVLRRSDAE